MYTRYIRRLFLVSIIYLTIALFFYEITTWLWREFKGTTQHCSIHTKRGAKNIVNVGVLLMATGKYADYASPFVDAARTFFLSSTCNSTSFFKVYYYIFSNRLEKIPGGSDIIPIAHDKMGWPYDSMMRCSAYVKALSNHTINPVHRLDYLFSIDTDVRFVRPVGEEVLGKLVGTLHPGYVTEPGKWERNRSSAAFVEMGEEKHYYTGAIFGGAFKEFIDACMEIDLSARIDLARNVIASWHDESHLNRYFVDHPPELILPPIYYWPEEWEWNFAAKLLALKKKHFEMRQ